MRETLAWTSPRARCSPSPRCFPTGGSSRFSVLYVTDDYFASDIFNGELPGRVLVGQLLRDGQLPRVDAASCARGSRSPARPPTRSGCWRSRCCRRRRRSTCS